MGIAWAWACRPSCACIWHATMRHPSPPSPPTSTTGLKWWPATRSPATWTTCCTWRSAGWSTSRASCSTSCWPRPAWPTSTPASCCARSRPSAACPCQLPDVSRRVGSPAGASPCRHVVEASTIQRTEHASGAPVEDMGVDLRGADILVSQQLLDRAQVGAGLEQVGGEAVTQRMRRDRLAETAGPRRTAHRLLQDAGVEMVALLLPVERIARTPRRREHELPVQQPCRLPILAGQRMRQLHGPVAGIEVLRMQRTYLRQLQLQCLVQPTGQHGLAILAAL